MKSVDDAFAVHSWPIGAVTVTAGKSPVALLRPTTRGRLTVDAPTVSSSADTAAARFFAEVLDDSVLDDGVLKDAVVDALDSVEELEAAVDAEADVLADALPDVVVVARSDSVSSFEVVASEVGEMLDVVEVVGPGAR